MADGDEAREDVWNERYGVDGWRRRSTSQGFISWIDFVPVQHISKQGLAKTAPTIPSSTGRDKTVLKLTNKVSDILAAVKNKHPQTSGLCLWCEFVCSCISLNCNGKGKGRKECQALGLQHTRPTVGRLKRLGRTNLFGVFSCVGSFWNHVDSVCSDSTCEVWERWLLAV